MNGVDWIWIGYSFNDLSMVKIFECVCVFQFLVEMVWMMMMMNVDCWLEEWMMVDRNLDWIVDWWLENWIGLLIGDCWLEEWIWSEWIGDWMNNYDWWWMMGLGEWFLDDGGWWGWMVDRNLDCWLVIGWRWMMVDRNEWLDDDFLWWW